MMDGAFGYAATLARDLIPGFNPAISACVLLSNGGFVKAVVAFTEWHDGVVGISIGSRSPRWATRENINSLAHYVFKDMGVRKLVATTDTTNERAIRMLHRAGFKFEAHLLKHSSAGADMFQYRLFADDWKDL